MSDVVLNRTRLNVASKWVSQTLEVDRAMAHVYHTIYDSRQKELGMQLDLGQNRFDTKISKRKAHVLHDPTLTTLIKIYKKKQSF